MANKVKIRGTVHEIQPFSDIHLSTVNKLLNDIGNIAFQKDTGFVLKEIIIPTLPPDIVRRTQAGEHIIFLSATELNDVLTEIMRFYYENELIKAKNSDNTTYIDQLKQNIQGLDTDKVLDQENIESEDSQQEIDRLKKQISLLEGEVTPTPQ